jgi:hypothetical protein
MKRAEIESLAFRLSRPAPSDVDLLLAVRIIRGVARDPGGEALVTRIMRAREPAPAPGAAHE